MGSAYWGKQFSELGSNGVQFPCLKREQPPTLTEWARGAVWRWERREERAATHLDGVGQGGSVALGEEGREGSHPP